MAKKSSLQDLMALYGSAPAASTGGDYEAPKAKKKKQSAPVRQVQGFKITDYDALSKTESAAKRNDSDDEEDDRATMEVDAELEDRLALERRVKRSREQGSGWVDSNADGSKGGGDLSPPRKRARNDTGDLSPPRRGGGDLSPPRRGSSTGGGGDLSPPRKGAVGSSSGGGDISPPRRGRASEASGDISPPRRGGRADKSGDISPPRKPTGASSSNGGGDISPPRRGGGGDISPPRASSKVTSTGSMISGERAGLYSADEIVAENSELRSKQMNEIKKMRPQEAGKDAATIYRDKRGRPLAMLNQMVNQDKVDFKDDTADMEWGVGKVDHEAKKEKEELDEKEKERGYHGTTIHDERYNERMKEKMRWDDPMARYVQPKKKIAKKLYQGYCPPNRYDIRPGYRWDGVDRSNGFESKIYTKTNEAAAMAEKQLMWAQSDM